MKIFGGALVLVLAVAMVLAVVLGLVSALAVALVLVLVSPLVSALAMRSARQTQTHFVRYNPYKIQYWDKHSMSNYVRRTSVFHFEKICTNTGDNSRRSDRTRGTHHSLLVSKIQPPYNLEMRLFEHLQDPESPT